MTRTDRTAADNKGFTIAGVSCFVGQERGKLKFSSSDDVQWLKSLPAYSGEPLCLIVKSHRWQTK